MSIWSRWRGWWGETKNALNKMLFLDRAEYIDINDVTIPTSRGLTQIDHIIVSRFGIFVVETKNMRGWIFGNPRDPEWTQVFWKKTFKFQNPLRQNYRHTRALSELTGVNHDHIFSIIRFWGDCVFKTPMPPNVIQTGYTDYIKSMQHELFDDAEVRRIVAAIRCGMLPRGRKTRRALVAELKQRHGSDGPCKRCGNRLVERTTRLGAGAGSRFLGCSTYPACRYTRSIPMDSPMTKRPALGR
jgi:hypothetical protein